MPPPRCGQLVALGSLRPGIEAAVVLCILLGIDRAREVTLRSGESALVTSLYLADPSAALGVELRVWGIPGIRLAHLRPLDVLHVPAVTIRLSKSGHPSLSTRSPQHISQFKFSTEAQANCPCAHSEIARVLALWTADRHAALRNVPLRPASPPAAPQSRAPRAWEERHPREQTCVENGIPDAAKTVRVRVSAVRLRAPRGEAIADSLAAAVGDVCGGCGEGGSCACARVPRKMVLRAAVRVELTPVGPEDGDVIVAHCEGDDLARLLLSTPRAIVADGGASATAVLRALAADRGVFDAVIEDGGGPDGIPLLRFLLF